MDANWKKADTNGDGIITADEFAQLPRIAALPEEKRAALFRRFDKDGDGRIPIEELRQHRPQRPAFPPLEHLDTDKDGKISFAEFQKVDFVSRQPEERQKAMFARMDRNGDGVLTPADGPPPGAPPHEGGRGRREPDPRGLIRRLDTNADGALSFEEFRKAGFVKDLGEDAQEEKFNELDRNKDQKIDAADLPAPPPGAPPHPPGHGRESDADQDQEEKKPE